MKLKKITLSTSHMSNDTQQSLISRTGVTLGAIMFLTVINMVVSFLTAESTENDAVRINVAGSLRMQSYRITEALLIGESNKLNPGDEEILIERIAEFEQRFNLPVLKSHIQSSSNRELTTAFDILNKSWLELKHRIVSKDPVSPSLLQDIDVFVGLLDKLVSTLAAQTENKFRLLRLLQGFSLFVISIIMVLGYVDVNSNVVTPLKRLLSMANNIQSGDFSGRLLVTGNDELSTLSQTFNEMSASLDAMIKDLAKKVQEKTEHLEQARDGLTLLYETSRLISGEGSVIERLEKSLEYANGYFPDAKIVVELHKDDDIAFYIPPRATLKQSMTYSTSFEISRQGKSVGSLAAYTNTELDEEHSKLLQAIADNIAAALNADWNQDQQHRLVLMEERTVIARELHDSLAQSLSYLKIQVSRIHMLREKNNDPKELDNTVVQIKAGIDAAYRQLRELLATFRLQLSNEGLLSSLDDTILEFSERAGLPIHVDYHLSNIPLTPNEEIHILQIVRESLSNVARHSDATRADVKLIADNDNNIVLSIIDNGCGFTEADLGTNHYGKIIMQERARTLNGAIEFINRAEGGAQVRLHFCPSAVKNHREQPEQSV